MAIVMQNEQVTEISKLKQRISELQVQLENTSSDNGGVAEQGVVANDALKDKLSSTMVSDILVNCCHGDRIVSMNY